MKKLTTLLFTLALLLGTTIPTPAQSDEGFENKYVRVTVLSLNIKGKEKAVMTLKVDNVSGKKIGLSFFYRNSYPALAGQDGSVGKTYNQSSNVNGIKYRKRPGHTKADYTFLGKGRSAVVTLIFHFSDKTASKIYHFSSEMAVYNEENEKQPITFSSGIYSIKAR